MPYRLFGDAFAPSFSRSAHAPEYLSYRDTAHLAPLVNLLFNLAGGNDVIMARMRNPAAARIGQYVGATLPCIWGVIVPTAGLMMLNRRSYGFVMAGVIFAMLPCSPGCLLGMPFGIWALVVLNQPAVRSAFS